MLCLRNISQGDTTIRQDSMWGRRTAKEISLGSRLKFWLAAVDFLSGWGLVLAFCFRTPPPIISGSALHWRTYCEAKRPLTNPGYGTMCSVRYRSKQVPVVQTEKGGGQNSHSTCSFLSQPLLSAGDLPILPLVQRQRTWDQLPPPT